MTKKINIYFVILSFAIITLPFLNFLNNNFNEIRIILVKSFYILILFQLFFIIILSLLVKIIFKKFNYYISLVFTSVSYWLIFKHNFLNLLIKNYSFILDEYSSEISLVIIIFLIILNFIILKKKNKFFIRFISFFFILNFIFNIAQLSYNFTKIDAKVNLDNKIIFYDNLNLKKENIYFFILDAMQPIDKFEKDNDIDLVDFKKFIKENNYIYKEDTINFYSNTTHSLSAVFYLEKIFDEDNLIRKETSILYPTLLRKKNQSNLINNLNHLSYDFKWIGNYFAYCPKFNLKYCLNDKNSYFDSYLYINFYRQTPLIQIITKFGYIINFDFDKKFFFNLNNGIGRLTSYLKKNDLPDKQTFYFVHHMSPHWPYLTSNDCKYKKFPGEKNLKGYNASYYCVLKRIIDTITYLEKYDPNATVIFQSDHNSKLFRDKDEKHIFNLFKLNKSCEVSESQNLNNVNILRLVFSCMTGNSPNFINLD